MKKRNFLAILLAALMLLASCTPAEQPTPEDSTSEQQTEAREVLEILGAEGIEYDIIRPEKCTNDVKEEFMKIRSHIQEKYGVSLAPKDDWINPNKPVNEYEILFGNVDRDEARQVYSELKLGEYAIRAVGKKLVIVGKSDELTILAGEYFIENFLNAEKPEIYTDLCYIGREIYALEEVTIGGVPLDQFVIVKPASASYDKAVTALSEGIQLYCGFKPEVKSRSEKSAHEIVIGSSDRDPSAKTYGYDDTEIYVKDGSLFIGCSSAHSAEVGVNYLISCFAKADKTLAIDSPAGKPYYSFISASREEYIKDPTKLQMHWAYSWEPDAELIKYENKKAALMCTDKDHILTVSHRADWIYYPENCIESIISVWAMGGDCVEIDLHFTKDGVCVLMHDATLTRMTNFSDLAGKNGLPTSNQISDWTYEQLQQLNLKDGGGGSGAAITPYKIPTLEEALVVCKNRLFVILDKPDLWKYCDIPGIQPGSADVFIYPIMERANNFESVLISYSVTSNAMTPGDAIKIQNYVYERQGVKMLTYLRAWNSRSNVASTATALEKGSLSNSGILVDGAYNHNNYSKIKAVTEAHPNSFFGSWTIADDTDNKDVWEEMYSAGLRSIMTNNIFALVQFAQKKIVK